MDAVGAVGRALLDAAQEHDLVAPLAHRDVQVLDRRQVGRDLGQLGVVGGEQRARARHLGQVLGDRPGERDAVEGARAPPDLVEDHEAAVGRVVEDVRGLAHLDHERRLAAREVVLGADAREERGRTGRRAPSQQGTNEPICAISTRSAAWRM